MTWRALLLSRAGRMTVPLADATTDPIGVARLALCGAALGAVVSGAALLGGLPIVGVLLLLALAHPATLGMGEVKLALLVVVLGGDASRALAIGLVLAALAGLLVLARAGRGAGRRALALAPFLALGSLLVLWP